MSLVIDQKIEYDSLTCYISRKTIYCCKGVIKQTKEVMIKTSKKKYFCNARLNDGYSLRTPFSRKCMKDQVSMEVSPKRGEFSSEGY